MESPFFKDFSERAEVQAKLRRMESELQAFKQDNQNLREGNAKLVTENKLRSDDVRL